MAKEDPLGDTFGMQNEEGSVAIVDHDSRDALDMSAMLKQMQQSVLTSQLQRQHTSLSRSTPATLGAGGSPATLDSPPEPAPQHIHAPNAAAVAAEFEAMFCNHVHEGGQAAGAMVGMPSAVFTTSQKRHAAPPPPSAVAPPAVMSWPSVETPSLAPTEIGLVPSRAKSLLSVNWDDDRMVEQVLGAHWLQLSETWTVVCERMTKEVRDLETIHTDLFNIAALQQEEFSPSATTTKAILTDLQFQFQDMAKRLTELQTIVWNVRRQLRRIAQLLHQGKVPTSIAWRDNVGEGIVAGLNKALTLLSARHSAARREGASGAGAGAGAGAAFGGGDVHMQRVGQML